MEKVSLDMSITESFLDACEFEYIGEEPHHEDKKKLEPKQTEKGAKVEAIEGDKNLSLLLSLQPGSIYESFNAFEALFQKYCDATFTNVRKERSWATSSKKLLGLENFPYKRVEYQCIHFGHKKKHTLKDGSRPNQSYSCTGCNFELHISVEAKKRHYVIRKFVDTHTGHTPSHESFINYRKNRILTEDEKKLYIEKYMMDLDIPTRKVQQEIKRDTGKIPTGKNLQRALQAAKKNQGKGTDMEELIKLLEGMKSSDAHSTVQIAYADSDKQPFCNKGKKIIKIIFFQTGHMKRLFAKHGTVLSIDGTYNLCNNQYVLVPYHVIDNHFRTRVCGFSILSNETSQVMKAALEMFEEANMGTANNIRYLIVDKDFVEISAAGNVFGNAKIVICQWHAMRRVDSVIHKLSLSSNKQHLKSELMHLFKTMVNATSEELYFSAWNTVVQRGQEHSEIEPFVKYLGSNWHMHRDHFATHRLQTYPLFMTFTNNRAENFNKQLKQVIKKQSPVTEVVKKAIEISERQQTDATRLDVKSRDQIFMPTDAKDPTAIEALREGRGLLTHEILQKLRIECEKVRNIPVEHLNVQKNATKCTLLSGECKFARNFELPCSHLLATRKNNGEALLEEGMIGKQWIIDTPDSKDETQVSNQKHQTLFVKRNETTRKAKYNDNMATMKEMASAMAQFPEGERAGLMHQLELLMNAWNNGVQTKIDDDTIKFLLSPKKKESLTSDLEELDIENIIFSPKKQNNSYSSSNGKEKKRRELFPPPKKSKNYKEEKQQEDGNSRLRKMDELEDWQQTIVNRFKHDLGAGKHWRKTDFEKLSNQSLCGVADESTISGITGSTGHSGLQNHWFQKN